MAIIGRQKCPDCGFDHAHVKQSEGKRPYRHCPECGLMTHAKNGAQAKLLTANMRPLPGGHVPQSLPHTDDPIIFPGAAVAPAAPVAAAPEPAATPAAPKKPAGLWDALMKGGK
jgi:hypothetical protein